LLRDSRMPALAAPDSPTPKETEAFPMSGNDRCWFDNHHDGFPVTPNTTQPHPEDAISRRQS
jgi:hypothetical protein